MVLGPSFVVSGIAPPAVRKASDTDRAKFWAAVSLFVAAAKDLELRQGLDKDGEALAPLAAKTIKYRRSAMGPADPYAPPLQPAHGLSRTRSLFTVEVADDLDGVNCFWSYDAHTGGSWGDILQYHADGAGNLPVRDVIGLSTASLATVKSKADAWWRNYVKKNVKAATEQPKPAKPQPAPKSFTSGRATALKATPPKGNYQTYSQLNNGKHIYTIQRGGLGRPSKNPPPTFGSVTFGSKF
jgi:hypothetical protein